MFKNLPSHPAFSNLQPRRADLDMNQHVNNVAYIGWVLEVVRLSFKFMSHKMNFWISSLYLSSDLSLYLKVECFQN